MPGSLMPQPRAGQPAGDRRPGALALCLGLAVFALPTLVFTARTAWTSEQGAHGPIVLAIGLWLAHRQLPGALALAHRPSALAATLPFAPVLPAFMVARIGGIVELEGYLMYLGLLGVFHSLVGWRAMRALWFPLAFLALAFPPPETLVALATQPLKLAVSHAAVSLLDLAGYPVGGEGVHLYIGQYELLVAEACSGLNALVSLTALAVLYVHLRHRAGPGYVALFAGLSLPVAVLANLIRVLALVLLTYHGGEAAGQGFLHVFAGLTTFAAALGLVIAVDAVLRPIWAGAARAAGPGR